MANDFSHIGVALDSAEDFGRLITSNMDRWPATSTPVGGSYVRAGGADGSEFWIQRGPTSEPLGGHPHFSGTSRFNLKVSEILDLRSLKGTPLEGSLMCLLVDDQPDVPMLVDMPDFRMHAAWLTQGAPIVLQLCAFPRGVLFAADEDAFRKTPVGTLSPNGSLIPSGLFSPEGGRTIPPRSEVIFAGRVESCRTLQSELGGKPFHGLTVRTLGGVVDVPLAADTAQSPPAPGSIIAGTFALSGRLISPLPNAPANVMESARRDIAKLSEEAPAPKSTSKPSFLGRLFGR